MEAENAELEAENAGLQEENSFRRETERSARMWASYTTYMMGRFRPLFDVTECTALMAEHLRVFIVKRFDLEETIRILTRMKKKDCDLHPIKGVRELREMIKKAIEDNISRTKLETPCIVESVNPRTFPILMSLDTFNKLPLNSRGRKTFPMTQNEDIKCETRCTQIDDLVEVLKRVLDFLRSVDPSFRDL